MPRMYAAQQCLSPSDAGIGDTVCDSQAIRSCLGINLSRKDGPSATTPLQFRRLLESHDMTQVIFKEYEEYIYGWVSEPDNGVYDAMNKGIDMAEGIWLCFINAGDTFCSDHALEDVMASADRLPISLFLYGGAEIVNDAGKLLTVLSPLRFAKRNLNVLATRTMCHQSIFVAKSIVPKCSPYFRLKGELGWYYALLRMLGHGQVNVLPFWYAAIPYVVRAIQISWKTRLSELE